MRDHTLVTVFASGWVVAGVASAILLAGAECGYRLGYRLHATRDEGRKSQVGNVQAAVLGMLGLLLGFTFAMAVSRYDARRELVLKEANAIGTAYLRAAFLPDARKGAAEALLRSYVDARLGFYDAGRDDAKRAESEAEAARLQRELWAHAVAAGKETPTPLVNGFVQALNDTIDADAARLHAMRAHVPAAVWVLVLVVAGCGCCLSGYHAGANGARGAFGVVVLPLLVAVVMTVLADLDHSHGGVIGISQQPLLDLKQSIRAG